VLVNNTARPAADTPESADLVVVGGGILGLAVAREALLRNSDLRVVVLEKEPKIGSHQTGRNSGVVHAGIYYAPGSLKARLCVQGSRELVAYCKARKIPYDRCGKLIVATSEAELSRLSDLERRAAANGVSDVEMVDEKGIAQLEPNAAGLRGLYSPNTGTVDFRRVAEAFAEDVAAKRGSLRCGTEVVGMRATSRGVELQTGTGRMRAGAVITCGGLHADRLARMTGAPMTPKIVPFRGTYFSLGPGASGLLRGHVYPVPDPAFPFLGVHATKRISGEYWAGPNAILALAREGYRGRNVRLRDAWETFAYPGFRALARAHWRMGLAEARGELSRSAFARDLQRLVPRVRAADLVGRHSGVRAQALSEDGRLLDDFWFDRAENVVHVRNAPSPGATSSLAIAREILSTVGGELSLR
jgi:L-2-hydroxyglutarate oxidase LhgO